MSVGHPDSFANDDGRVDQFDFNDGWREPRLLAMRAPAWAVLLTIACLIPVALLFVGVNFSTVDPQPKSSFAENLFLETAQQTFYGSFTHAILKWTAVCAVVYIGLRSLLQYRMMREALEILEDSMFDLIFMDIFLPLHGWYRSDATVRKDPRFAKVPILATTVHAIEGQEAAILNSGVDEFVTNQSTNNYYSR